MFYALTSNYIPYNDSQRIISGLRNAPRLKDLVEEAPVVQLKPMKFIDIPRKRLKDNPPKDNRPEPFMPFFNNP